MLLEFVGDVLRRSAAQARAHAASAAAAAPAQPHMLPLDDDYVVDASGAGGTASFIRHSGRCRPLYTGRLHMQLLHTPGVAMRSEVVEPYIRTVGASICRQGDALWRLSCSCGTMCLTDRTESLLARAPALAVCRPNCRACVLEGREGRRIFVLAARQLTPDEELTCAFCRL